MDSLRPRTLRTSSELHPSTSRSVITARWLSGSAAIAALPDSQRAVITMRDVDGWSSEEVRNVLGLSESNQRVLLHRARAKVRRALETYLEGDRS